MLRPRVIPVLLMSNGRLVKGRAFSGHEYVGDPMNAVRIFNGKNADEILLVDIGCRERLVDPDCTLVEQIAEESFMPFGVGGGVRTLEQIGALLRAGAEKVLLNTAAHETPGLIRDGSRIYGRQAIMVGIDVGSTWFFGKRVYSKNGAFSTGKGPVEWAKEVELLGAGEILLTSISREGSFRGFDLDLIRQVSKAVSIPVVGQGGAGSYEDLRCGIQAGASAVAAGSLFLFCGKERSVLINYPDHTFLESLGSLTFRAMGHGKG